MRENSFMSVDDVLKDFYKNKLGYYNDEVVIYAKERPYEKTTWAALSLCLNSIFTNTNTDDLVVLF